MTLVQHTSNDDAWETPGDIIELARMVLGAIDLDPASSVRANLRVKATRFYDEGEDGLSQPWRGRVFLNPPGGKYPKGHEFGNASKTSMFWEKLMSERFVGNVPHAIVVLFSISSLQVLQRGGCGPLRFPMCVPANRIAFVPSRPLPAGKKNQPAHANAIIYVHGAIDRTDLFYKTFKTLGDVR